jgi:hypothetical protein
VIWWSFCIIKVLAAFLAEKKVSGLLPHLENQHQWNVNNIWPCNVVKQNELWQALPIYEVITKWRVSTARFNWVAEL